MSIFVVSVFFLATVVASYRVMANFRFEAPKLQPIIKTSTDLGLGQDGATEGSKPAGGLISAETYMQMEKQ